MAKENPFRSCVSSLQVNGQDLRFCDLTKLNDERYEKLPYSIRVLVESAVRNCDEFEVQQADIESILAWETNQTRDVEIPFKPARVILQDFTGVPAVVDFAAMRDAVKRLGGDPQKINPVCPADLVIDHSVQVDVSRSVLRFMPNPGGGGDPSASRFCGGGSVPHSSSPVTHRHNPANSATSGRRSEALGGTSVTSGRRSKALGGTLGTPGRRSTALGGTSGVSGRRSPALGEPSGVSGRRSAALGSSSGASGNKLPENTSATPCAGCSVCTTQRVPAIYEICPFHHLPTEGAGALARNEEMEFERNNERFLFLKWGAKALQNMLIVPPGSGIVHQVNLEYLARVVFNSDGMLYPDSLVGTDSHTTMINGLGVVGWGVGGIEAEAVMLGQSISMVLPQVVGYKITGSLGTLTTSTDVVLTITKHLRSVGVVGKFVEFFGPGVAQLSIADRATIANMCPEYGATVGYFPVDAASLEYLAQTGRESENIAVIEAYLKANKMFRDFTDSAQDPVFSQVIELDLGSVVPCCSGPKRPHDRVPVSEMKEDFTQCLTNKIGFKGFAIPEDRVSIATPFVFEDREYVMRHGSVVIAAITSCTNTSNPSVMLGAGLLAKKAVEAGLSVSPYIKTSLSPGSGVVTYYLKESGVLDFLDKLGFNVVGYGCMTCIGNSGPLSDPVADAIDKGQHVAVGVLSGNRNFEGRIHPLTQANYLASPPLVIAYALAGTVCIDFETEPLGHNSDNQPVFLRDIWPTRDEIQVVERAHVIPAMFKEVYSRIQHGNERWNSLKAPEDQLYAWDPQSTYIKSPPFFETMTKEMPSISAIRDAHVLLNLGDSVTTDHISPAGSIARNSAAARYLAERGMKPREFNSYGSRRGNDEVMARGTFANIHLLNKFIGKAAPKTVHLPTQQVMDVYDAAMAYRATATPVIVLAGKEYGSGSSRDWAAKGPWILGIRAVIAESYERIHRSNLVGMGIIPMQYVAGQTAESLGLTGKEKFNIELPEDLKCGEKVTVTTDTGVPFEAVVRFDTEVELSYFRNGGILNTMIRNMLL